LTDSISKITRGKWTGGVVQVVEYLPCKHEALSSAPQFHQKKKKKKPDMVVHAIIPATQAMEVGGSGMKPAQGKTPPLSEK
jgi:hypothetical protein